MPGRALLLPAAHNHGRRGGGGAGGARGTGGGGGGGGGRGGRGECCRVGEVIQHVGHLVLMWLLVLVGGWGVGVAAGGVGGVPGGVGGFRRIGLIDWVVVGVGVGWLILRVGVGGWVDGLVGGVGDGRWLGVGVGRHPVPVAVPCSPTQHQSAPGQLSLTTHLAGLQTQQRGLPSSSGGERRGELPSGGGGESCWWRLSGQRTDQLGFTDQCFIGPWEVGHVHV